MKSVYRFWLIMRTKPSNNLENRIEKSVKIFLATLLLILIGFQVYIAIMGYPPFFKPDLLICMALNYKSKDINGTLTSILNLALTVVPVFAMIILNTGIAVKLHLNTRQVNKTVPRRSLMALGGVTWCFAVSYTFVIGHLVLEKVTGQKPWYEVTMMYLLGANVICNPIIYFGVNKRFRDFVIKGKMRSLEGRSSASNSGVTANRGSCTATYKLSSSTLPDGEAPNRFQIPDQKDSRRSGVGQM